MTTLPTPITSSAVDDIASSHEVWHESLHRKSNYIYNVVDFGAVGDDITDDAATIQAATADAEAALPVATVEFPPLQYKIVTGVTVLDCDIESARGAELIVDTGIAAGITIGSSVTSCDHHRLQLPNVTRISRDWDSTPTINTARGVLVAAADGCQITVGVITDFSFGLVVEGDGQGVAYNTFLLSAHTNNAVNIYLDAINSGWSNQNTYIGGRNTHSDIGGTPPYAGTRNIEIATGNNNTFLGVSFEGGNEEYLAFIGPNASSNRFVNCRWEVSGDSNITFQGDGASVFSQANVIEGGIHSDVLVVTADPGDTARYNSILAERQQLYEGSDADGVLLIQNVDNSSRAISLFPSSGTSLLNMDQNADYGARLGALTSGWKAEADGDDRISMNHALGRMFFGIGSAPETLYIRAGAQDLFDIVATAGVRMIGTLFQDGLRHIVGSGDPESSETAPIGSTYMRSDGGAGTSFYVKESGTGDTGWVAK